MNIPLEDGSRVAVIGGGPAGSLSAYFLLTFASRVGLDLKVDIFEPRDFTQPGPGGCNMCAGIVSESLIQFLASDGINLPTTVVQRGIDSYVLHTDETSVTIDTPLHEKRIAAVHRGGGPRDVSEVRWGGLDGYLLGLAQQLGARVVKARVSDVAWDQGRPQVQLREGPETYDLLVGAIGVNSASWRLFESLGLSYTRPKTTKAYITELNIGTEDVNRLFGSSMNLFLTDLPRVDFAGIIPKGEFATVCLLGDDIDSELVESFFNCDAIKRCFPAAWELQQGACHCSPWINVREASKPFMDRLVLVGDCGATRLYKDGIGAAYRTAKAAALAAVFNGVSESDFQEHYLPAYRAISSDNRYGELLFGVVHRVHKFRPLIRGVMRMAALEQKNPGMKRRLSIILWDMFTGSAPYRDIFFRALDPRFWGRFMWETALAIPGGATQERKGVEHGHQ